MPEGFLYYICPVWGMSRKWRQIEGSKWHFSAADRLHAVPPARLRDFPTPRAVEIHKIPLFSRGAHGQIARKVLLFYGGQTAGGAWAFSPLRGQKNGKFVKKTCNDKQICAFCKTKLLDYVYQRRILWICRTT